MKNKIAIFTLSLLGLYQPAQAITLIGWDIPSSASVPAPTGSTAIHEKQGRSQPRLQASFRVN